MIGQNGVIGNGNMNIALAPRGVHVGVHIVGVGRCPDISVKLRAAHGSPPGNVPHDGGFNAAVQKCVAQLRIRDVLTYQPASRYWTFQWYELAIYLGLALILAGVCFWWVRRRLT